MYIHLQASDFNLCFFYTDAKNHRLSWTDTLIKFASQGRE
jgi:hypothetical protein